MPSRMVSSRTDQRTPRNCRRTWVRTVVMTVCACALLFLGVYVGAVRGWLGERASAAAIVVEAFDLVATVPFGRDTIRTEVDVGGLRADRWDALGWSPRNVTRQVILVPGAVPAGRDDQRVQRIAQALARQGIRVWVPELAVYSQQLDTVDVERISLLAASVSSESTTLVVLGVSFGGSLSLLAASEPDVSVHIDGVKTFGAYADLWEVASAVVLGEAFVDGQSVTFQPVPEALEVVANELVRRLPDGDRPALLSVLDGGESHSQLSSDAKAIFDFLTATTRADQELARAQMSSQYTSQFDELSPVGRAPCCDVPTIVLHARHDPVIPYAEALRLESWIADTQLLTLNAFGHTDQTEGWTLRHYVADAYVAWRFTSAVLQPEPT